MILVIGLFALIISLYKSNGDNNTVIRKREKEGRKLKIWESNEKKKKIKGKVDLSSYIEQE